MRFIKKSKIYLIVIIILIIILLLVGTCWGIWSYQNRDVVRINNKEFTSMIKKTIGKSDEEKLMKEDLILVTEVTIKDMSQMKYLDRFPNLKSVILNDVDFTIEELMEGGYLNQIEIMDWWDCNVNGNNSEMDLPNLQEIRITNSLLSDCNNIYKKLVNLTKFVFYDNLPEVEDYINAVYIFDIEDLCENTELNSILIDCGYKNAEQLAKFSRLKKLDLDFKSDIDFDYKIFSQLSQLEELWCCNITQENFDLVCNMANLKKLYLNFNNNKKLNWSNITKLNQLEDLSVDYVTQEEFDVICNLVNIKWIFLYFSYNNANKVVNLSNISKLTEIEGIHIEFVYGSDPKNEMSFVNYEGVYKLEYLTSTYIDNYIEKKYPNY